LAEPWKNRGIARQARGDLDGALADYDRSIRLRPKVASTYSNRGTVHHLKGDLEEPSPITPGRRNSIRASPKLMEDRGNARMTKGDAEGALADYGRAIELKPNFATAYFNRAFVFREKGNLYRALTDYNQAILLNPRYPDAWALRGSLKLRMDQEAEAQEDFDQCLRSKPILKASLETLIQEQRLQPQLTQDGVNDAADLPGVTAGACACLKSASLATLDKEKDNVQVQDLDHRLLRFTYPHRGDCCHQAAHRLRPRLRRKRNYAAQLRRNAVRCGGARPCSLS